MIRTFLFSVLLFCAVGKVYGQHSVSLTAVLNDSLKTLSIEQELIYHNTSSDTLYNIYLNDWLNAFSSKSTPLAKRFAEDYKREFHFSRQKERGFTKVGSITGKLGALSWERPKKHPDLIKINLASALPPGEKTIIHLKYTIKIPSDDFTRYGYSKNGNYKLRYWFLTPAVYEQTWNVYSNKNLNDLFNPPLDLDITLKIPNNLAAVSGLNTKIVASNTNSKKVHLTGKNRLDYKLYLTRYYLFEEFRAGKTDIITNMDDEGLSPIMRNFEINRIFDFLNSRLGPYPHTTMLVTREDYLKNPVYGLGQLPKFIRPFPEGFHYDLKLFKTISGNYLEQSLLLNPRKEKWIFDAIQVYLMMKYVDNYYPKMKILGSLADIIGIKWLHAADLEFNDQYRLLYMFMARNNLDQPLTTSQDSLLNFNKEIANAYKAGAGMNYLDNFLQDSTITKSIKEFYSEYTLKPVAPTDFERIMKENAEKDIAWFFEDYVSTDEKIDFKIKNAKKQYGKLQVTIKNKTENDMPVSLYGLNDKNVVFKTWIQNVDGQKTISIPADSIERLALNYKQEIPEFNQRDNYKGITTLLNKPIQFRLLQDVEDPRYNQLFLMPAFEYNLYDGIALGPQIYNHSFLEKNFYFQIAPMYGFNSETLVGSASFSYRIQYEDKNLSNILFGAGGSRFSYGYGLFYEKFYPYLQLTFRDPYLRNNKRQYLTVRNVNVYRDQNLKNSLDAPDYSVFNIKYDFRNTGMVDYFTTNVDFQLAEQFSKISFTLEYRQLFKNNRQIDLRLFAGTFLYNDLTNSNYFSFALDRPTDYLYDYNYYGRSETSGLFSQQIILAEGGFKSQLQPEFANQWLTTINASTNIWNWVFVYGDVGLVKNKHRNAKFVYDSGIRLSFIADYFELYFPVYSSLGWEMAQENYAQKIRFIATLDLQTLIRLFSRDWL